MTIQNQGFPSESQRRAEATSEHTVVDFLESIWEQEHATFPPETMVALPAKVG